MHYFILFNGCIIFHCIYVPHLLYLFLCQWTFRKPESRILQSCSTLLVEWFSCGFLGIVSVYNLCLLSGHLQRKMALFFPSNLYTTSLSGRIALARVGNSDKRQCISLVPNFSGKVFSLLLLSMM